MDHPENQPDRVATSIGEALDEALAVHSDALEQQAVYLDRLQARVTQVEHAVMGLADRMSVIGAELSTQSLHIADLQTKVAIIGGGSR